MPSPGGASAESDPSLEDWNQRLWKKTVNGASVLTHSMKSTTSGNVIRKTKGIVPPFPEQFLHQGRVCKLKAIQGESSSQLRQFTCVPVEWRLPIKNVVVWKQGRGHLTRQADENPATLARKERESITDSMLSDGGLYKAEVVFIGDPEVSGSTGGPRQEPLPQCNPADHMTLPPPSPPIRAQQGHTAPNVVAAMETAVSERGGISAWGPRTPAPTEVSQGLNTARESERSSPSPDLYPTPGSSRESILSEGWDGDPGWGRSWWALPPMSPEPSSRFSPFSPSRTISPCSSVRSGTFSPTVVRLTRHALAPGSRLLHMPPPSDPPCGDSPCPLSPRARHRPPPTRLSLLTAILRKGRLPVLSSPHQRPYTPCWPINPFSLSTCKACSAASSLASIHLELSSRGTPPTSTPSSAHGHCCGDGSVVAPPCGSPPLTSTDRHPERRGQDRGGLYGRGTRSSPTPGPLSPLPPALLPALPPALPPSLPPSLSPLPRLPLTPDLPKSPLSPSSSSSSLRPRQPPEPDCSPQTAVAQISFPHACSPGTRLLTPENTPINSQQDRNHQKPGPPLHSSHPKLFCSSPQLINTPGAPASPASRLSSLSGPGPHSSLSRLYPASPIPTPLPSFCSCPALAPPSSSALPRPPPPSSSALPRPPPLASSPLPAQPLFSDSHIITAPPQGRGKPTPSLLFQNGLSDRPEWRKPDPHSPTAPPAHSSPPWAYSLSPSRYTPLVFPGSQSPDLHISRPSPSATPDRLALSPSPAPPSRTLTLSPSASLRSTPSPRPGSALSDCSDREGAKRKPHKIKLSYKALAAIPTNTLLLDQQAIDDSVETQGDHLDRLPIEDTHVEMCSPAQLRQQSEELYAVIDKVLQDPLPLRNPSPARWSSREFLDRGVAKPCTLSPRSMGRETKYATRHAHPAPESSLLDHNTTRPGVIKPVNSSPRLTVTNDDEDDDGDSYHGNPFRQYMQDLSHCHSSKLESALLRTGPGPGGCGGLGAGGGRRTAPGGPGGPPCLSALLISEGEGPRPPSPPAEGGELRSQTLCSPPQQPQALETHI
ncbi:LOW QUALITY PROTEIN: muscular LMNA-interacting protein [Osmerus mordax]|uniref:LOW QUALITY PROTEIN: muscular LMNA-interacting protein n=1 Tax=Osmerus mordax TaxID=8014 RepID=UPI003510D1DD